MFELNQDKGYSIKGLCKAINISCAGYYKWLNREPSEQESTNKSLATEIQRIYEESDRTYGVVRVKLAIYRELGLTINVKRVRRIMLYLIYHQLFVESAQTM